MLKQHFSHTTTTLRQLFFSVIKMTDMALLTSSLKDNEELYFSSFDHYDYIGDETIEIPRTKWRNAIVKVNSLLAEDDSSNTALRARGLARGFLAHAEEEFENHEGFDKFSEAWLASLVVAVKARKNAEIVTENRRIQEMQEQQEQLREMKKAMDELREMVRTREQRSRPHSPSGNGHPVGAGGNGNATQRMVHRVARAALSANTADLVERQMPQSVINDIWQDVYDMFQLTIESQQDRIKANYLLYLINNGTSSNSDPRRSVYIDNVKVPLSYIHSAVRSHGTLRQFARPQADLARVVLAAREESSAWARKNGFNGERELGFDFADGCSGVSVDQLALINEARSRALQRQQDQSRRR